jgi:hypothetical protein
MGALWAQCFVDLPIGSSNAVRRLQYLWPGTELRCLTQGDSMTSDSSRWSGHRHDWIILSGEMTDDVLGWLRADGVLVPGAAAFEAHGIRFKENKGTVPRPSVKIEQGRKWIMSGALGGGSCSKTMCTLDVSKDLPATRLQAWFRAFRSVNEDFARRSRIAPKSTVPSRGSPGLRCQPSTACVSWGLGHRASSGTRHGRHSTYRTYCTGRCRTYSTLQCSPGLT